MSSSPGQGPDSDPQLLRGTRGEVLPLRCGVVLELRQGDIARQEDVDVVVNAANAWLEPGGGVAGAIHRAAGPHLVAACRPLAPLRPGEAVITPAFNLPNRAIIHCLGPVWGRDHPEDRLLASCYRRALRLADERSYRSIAFPALSTGAFGYPLDAASAVAFEAVREASSSLVNLRLIRFVLVSDAALEQVGRVLAALAPSWSDRG